MIVFDKDGTLLDFDAIWDQPIYEAIMQMPYELVDSKTGTPSNWLFVYKRCLIRYDEVMSSWHVLIEIGTSNHQAVALSLGFDLAKRTTLPDAPIIHRSVTQLVELLSPLTDGRAFLDVVAQKVI